MCESKLRRRTSFREVGRLRCVVASPRAATRVSSLGEGHEVWEVLKKSRSHNGLISRSSTGNRRRFEEARGVPRRLPWAHASSGVELYDKRALISDAFE